MKITIYGWSIKCQGASSFPVLLIGAEVLPGKVSVKGLRRAAATRRRRALDGDLSR